jgi:hypothetical protein
VKTTARRGYYKRVESGKTLTPEEIAARLITAEKCIVDLACVIEQLRQDVVDSIRKDDGE